MKPLQTAYQRRLVDTLQTQLIPYASGGAPIALLDIPPKILGQNEVTEMPGKALPPMQGTGQVVRTRYWRDENLDSATVPILGCIVDGEADLEVGMTQAVCRKLKMEAKRWIVAMPQRSFFLITPETPISSYGKVHWRRAHPEKAYSRMLFIQAHETGAYCHFNTSDKGKLWTSPSLFVPQRHTFSLAHNLIHQMQHQSPRYLPITYFYLALILESILQGLLMPSKADNAKNVAIPPALSLSPCDHSLDERMRTILAYIDENLTDPTLSAESIAARFHLSPEHLRRLFQRAVATPTMKFVVARRLEYARQLLQGSSLNIKQICYQCGYKNPSSFTDAFLQHYGVSPSAFYLDALHE